MDGVVKAVAHSSLGEGGLVSGSSVAQALGASAKRPPCPCSVGKGAGTPQIVSGMVDQHEHLCCRVAARTVLSLQPGLCFLTSCADSLRVISTTTKI